jgi:succinate dehydrogenase / fumarate reductase cytochrome b subunit
VPELPQAEGLIRVTQIDEEKPQVQFRRHLRWGEQDPHRRANTPLSMWAWLWQRISALAIVVLLVFHITMPYRPMIQFLLLLVVTFHATLGLRVILLDFNLVSVRHHKALAWGLPAAGVVALFFIWRAIY